MIHSCTAHKSIAQHTNHLLQRKIYINITMFYSLLAWLFVIRLSHGASEEWIVIDVATSSTCEDSDTAFAVMSPVGECFPIPPDIDADFLQSYRFKDCAYVADTISIEFEFFMKNDCKGTAIPYIVSDISTDCVNNTQISCQTNPQAVVEDWPGFGFYVYDEKCSSVPSVVIAGKPGCASFAEYGNYSTSVQCESEGEKLHIQGYNASTTCEANTETMIDYLFDMDECVGFDVDLDDDNDELESQMFFTPLHVFQHFNSPLSAAVAKAAQSLSNTPITQSILSMPLFTPPQALADYDYYYYADCHMDSLPGVATTNSNNDNNDDDEDDYGGLGVVGMSFLIVILVGVFGAAMVMTHYVLKRMKTRTKEATLTDSIMGPSMTKSSDL